MRRPRCNEEYEQFDLATKDINFHQDRTARVCLGIQAKQIVLNVYNNINSENDESTAESDIINITLKLTEAVKLNLLTECKCHGVSGSCTMKTCWKSLPPFRTIGDSLMKKYYRARPVTSTYTTTKSDKKSEKKLQLVLKKGKMPIKKPPKKSELVFLQMSPNYCEKDLAAGSLGTVGRICNRTSEGSDGCDLMCCGRGYNTHQYTRKWQCNCKFLWCCKVECKECSERTEEYTCK
ncbi:wnt related [Holotrichia oblita]|uniref:Wnt related n=1 Tax=Holotrichia oblita TaxID=644536 RepID=A0ACB9TNR5_HOLOL|nr:wnt related [Holotrichia oblita]